jgi:hypothetical protein
MASDAASRTPEASAEAHRIGRIALFQKGQFSTSFRFDAQTDLRRKR